MGRVWKITRAILVLLSIVFLSTVAINATDNISNLENSLLGQVIYSGKGDDCPKGMVQVQSSNGEFCMDQFEASPNSSCRTDNPRNQEETLFNMTDSKCSVVSEKGNIPWRNIARHQAEELCARTGKRLPTNKEWYRAALGTPDTKASVQRNDCNVRGSGVRKTGEGELCVSGSKAYDMVGNAWEWVEEIAIEGVYNGRKLPETGYVTNIDTDGIAIHTNDQRQVNFNDDYFSIDHTQSRGMMRGGYWGNESDAGLYTVSIVTEPTFAGEGVGFRCVL